jgi:hypothetical protein
MAKLLAFLFAALMVTSPSFAQISRKQPTTTGPSALLSHAARMEHDAVEDIKAGHSGTGWFVDIDIVYPTDTAEYEAVGKYALMVFSLFSDDRDELPLAQVKVGGVRLECLDFVPRGVPADSASAKAFGKFRADTLCIVPAVLARNGKGIKLDFTKNHKDVEIGNSPFEEPDFVKADSDPRSPPKPNPAVLQRFIDREYPGFGFQLRQESSHIVYDKPPTRYGPVTLQVVDRELEDLSTDLLKDYPQGADRIAQGDGAYPLDAQEYAAFGNRGVIVVAAVTRNSDEFPLKRVYMRVKGKETDLVPLARVRRAVSNPIIAEAFGQFREDSLYVVPASAMADPDTVFLCDFAANRTGFVFSSSPYPPPDFIGPHPDERLGPPPGPAAIKAFLKREYPGFFDSTMP